jgi:hypothetical protein
MVVSVTACQRVRSRSVSASSSAAERQAARDPALAERWQDAQRRLKVGLGGDVHAAWLASIEVLSADDERLVLVTERKMQAAYVARNFSQDILGAWQAAGGRAWSISISTDASVSSPAALEAHP